MKKRSYKYQIEQELFKNNWNIDTIYSSTDWWDDEHWKVTSIYHHVSICIHFILDPMIENKNREGIRIATISAAKEMLKDNNDKTLLISNICMNKGKFDVKMKVFIAEINDYRKHKK